MPEVPTKFQRVLDRLTKVSERKPGLSWVACCPAHPDDTKPSLSVNIGATGNLVMTCHAPHGCTAKDIVKSLGMTMSDLFRSDRADYAAYSSGQRRKPEVVYQYHRADGTLAYETLRYIPKDFAQRRPNPDWRPNGSEPRYLYNLEGIDLVVYRLPKLLREWEINPERWCALVEGEKCADAMDALGILSTTHALGSDHWKDEYAETFRGKKVAIFYDCDPYQPRVKKRPGPAWAVQAARSLHAVGCTVRICHPPGCGIDSKEDVADFIAKNAARGARELKLELFGVIQSTEDYFPGWESMTGYGARQFRHRMELAKSGPGDMNDALEMVRRRLMAALDGVRLDSLADDLASAAAWCQWLAETVDAKMTVVNLKLDESAPPKISGAAHEEDATEAQDATEAESPAQELCLPAQVETRVETQVEAFEEPEII